MNYIILCYWASADSFYVKYIGESTVYVKQMAPAETHTPFSNQLYNKLTLDEANREFVAWNNNRKPIDKNCDKCR